LETDGWEIPTWRASSPTPPAARIASDNPGSLILFLLIVFANYYEVSLAAHRRVGQ